MGKTTPEQPETAVRSRFFRARGLLREAGAGNRFRSRHGIFIRRCAMQSHRGRRAGTGKEFTYKPGLI